MKATPKVAEKFAKIVGKIACLLMVCTLVAFSVRFHWNTIRVENGSGFIMFRTHRWLDGILLVLLSFAGLRGLSWRSDLRQG